MDFVALQIRQPIHISLDDEPPHHKTNMSKVPVKSLCMRAWPAFASELLAPESRLRLDQLPESGYWPIYKCLSVRISLSLHLS
jgi:hypothetical protein